MANRASEPASTVNPQAVDAGQATRPAPGRAEPGDRRQSEQLLRAYQDMSERLVGWLQLAVIIVLSLLYAASPSPDAVALMGVQPVPVALALYALFTIGKQILAYRRSLPGWLVSLSILVDMGLLFGLIWTFHLQYDQPPAFYLKAPTLLYVFIFIALRTLRFEIVYVLLAGGAAVIGWSVLAAYAALGTQHLLSPVTNDFVIYLTSPTILWGAEIDKMLAIVMVTGILAVAVHRARELLEKERHASAELAYLAYHDPVTGRRNLSGLLEHVPAMGAPVVGLAVIELEDLRKRLAVLGKEFSDHLVREAAGRIADPLTDSCLLARISEAEFMVAVRNPAGLDDMSARAARMVAAFQDPFHLDHRTVIQTVRAGVALWTPAMSVIDAVQDAQVAALRADSSRGPQVATFDDRLREAEIAFAQLEQDLRGAITRNDEIVLHYQPIFAIGDGRLAGFEALVRWDHPENGMIPPAEFIPMTEATGLIVPLGAKILEIAIRDLHRFDPGASLGYAGDGEGLFMSVNLAVRQIADAGFLATVTRLLRESGVDPSRLKLEVTESEATEAVANIRETLMALKAMGVSLSIDDFGTGYSSLGQLHALPFDVLKIDRSFVRDIAQSDQSRAVVQTVVDLARCFNLATVAEGIENADTLNCLAGLGVDMAQGYHTGRPAPFDAAADLVARQSSRNG